MGLRRAFQELLADTAKLHDWTLVTEDAFKTPATSPGKGATVRPDGTLRDKNTIPRAFWESKDTNDSFTAEIAKKSAKGYSLVNTIVEASQTAILYQNKKIAFAADPADPQALADLLNQSYAHTEPDIEYLEEAVNDFKDRVPDLARGLVKIIDEAHKKNPRSKKPSPTSSPSAKLPSTPTSPSPPSMKCLSSTSSPSASSHASSTPPTSPSATSSPTRLALVEFLRATGTIDHVDEARA